MLQEIIHPSHLQQQLLLDHLLLRLGQVCLSDLKFLRIILPSPMPPQQMPVHLLLMVENEE